MLPEPHKLSSRDTPSSPPVMSPIISGVRSIADDQIRYDRAWHVVTSRIALPSSVAAEDSFGTLAPESQLQSQDAVVETDFQAALGLVLYAKSALPRATHTDDILDWHIHQVRRHFTRHVLPMVSACAVGPDTPPSLGSARGRPADTLYYDQHLAVVLNSIRTLEAALRLYYYGLSLIVRGMEKDEKQEEEDSLGGDVSLPLSSPEAAMSRFRRDVHALVRNAVPAGLILSTRVVIVHLVSIVLGMHVPPRAASKEAKGGKSGPAVSGAGGTPEPLTRPRPPDDDDAQAVSTRQRLHELVESLSKVGLAGDQFQVLFAEIMDQMMADFVRRSYAGLWTSNQSQEKSQSQRDGVATRSKPRVDGPQAPSCIAALYDWIENHYARLSLEVLSRITTGKGGEISFLTVREWKETGLGRLAALRMSELFDIVLHWPVSRGGLDELRVSVTTRQRRLRLVTVFSAIMQRRLLHPGRSTLQILRVYIAMIRTFHSLDQSNVLLDGVVGPLQLYLCQRDDAVRIVVTGLLASPEEVNEAAESGSASTADSRSKPGKLVELAVLLNDPSQQRRKFVEDQELDWNDMKWIPDPIDAGVNYKRPKSEDVVGTIINALGSQDVFIKEFQNIIAERLLSAQTDFTQEVRVLELLKKRFGDVALQNCDVMIKDINDSRRSDAAIRRTGRQQRGFPATPMAQHPTTTAGQTEAETGAASDDELRYHSRILSRLYWPASLPRDSFRLPNPVAERQKHYDEGYVRLKASRKLEWLNQLGQATVELELADRSLTIDCSTAEAAVVYAFQDPGASGNEVRRSVEELEEMLHMDEDVLRSALAFWVRRGVLRSLGQGVYSVVETKAEGAAEDDGQAGAAAASPPRDVTKETTGAGDAAQRAVYWQFIVGMLTNSAASMPLPQIAMMMKMLIADGFPWSNEELLEFLGEKIVAGELEVVGGKYRLVKK